MTTAYLKEFSLRTSILKTRRSDDLRYAFNLRSTCFCQKVVCREINETSSLFRCSLCSFRAFCREGFKLHLSRKHPDTMPSEHSNENTLTFDQPFTGSRLLHCIYCRSSAEEQVIGVKIIHHFSNNPKYISDTTLGQKRVKCLCIIVQYQLMTKL